MWGGAGCFFSPEVWFTSVNSTPLYLWRALTQLQLNKVLYIKKLRISLWLVSERAASKSKTGQIKSFSSFPLNKTDFMEISNCESNLRSHREKGYTAQSSCTPHWRKSTLKEFCKDFLRNIAMVYIICKFYNVVKVCTIYSFQLSFISINKCVFSCAWIFFFAWRIEEML